MAREMTVGIDYTSRDYESIKQDMIAMLKRILPEYTDTSETDAGIVILECFAMGIDIVSFYQDIQANETMLYTCEQRRNALNWCRLLGYTPQSTTPAKVNQVFVLTNPNPYSTIIPAGTVVKTEPSPTEEYTYFTTEEDLIIPANKLGNEKDENGKYLYSVSAVHGTQITNEILGSSTGFANQSFRVVYYPVVSESIVVQVKEGDSWVTWERVSNFNNSLKLSRHYVVNVLDSNQVEIQFGDGNTGKIPPVSSNGIRVSYMNGGGIEGNVVENSLVLMHTSNPLVASTFNPEKVYQLGRDKESLSSIKINASNYNRVKWGALTITDFKDLVLAIFKDVQYCTAVENEENIDDIDIYVMMKDGVPLSEEVKEQILKELNERKVVGVGVINLMPMIEYPLNIVASLVVADNYSREKMSEVVKKYITDYFSVGKFDVSEDVSITDLESKVFNNLNGVYSFRITSPSDLVLKIPVGQIVSLKSIELNISGGV